MSERQKRKVKKRFKHYNIKKVILYKNPNEFCSMHIERVNPDHVGILWGKRKKNLNKGTHYIKWGKVYFSILPVLSGITTLAYIDALTQFAFNLLLKVGISGLVLMPIITYMIYFLPFKLGSDAKCQMC